MIMLEESKKLETTIKSPSKIYSVVGNNQEILLKKSDSKKPKYLGPIIFLLLILIIFFVLIRWIIFDINIGIL